jgi:two-component system, cell cycle sensor histidine kinase and response regulator CckA
VAVSPDHDIILALGEDLPVAISVARAPDGELVYTNRAFAELMGTGARSPVAVCTRDGAPYPETKLPFARALGERRVIVADDLMIRRGDGRRVEVRAVARPVGDPITHVITTFFDVSREVAAERARAESEQRLRRAQRLEAIGTLAGGIAHDFNNLIFSIKLIAAEIASTDQDPKHRAGLEMIDDVTDRSAVLTRSLVGFVRRSTQRVLPVAVNDVATSLTEMLIRTLPGIELSFELEATDRGIVVGDHAQLEQVIVNLVLAAREAVNDAGRIIVRTSDRALPGVPDAPRFVVLEVIDDGPGMSPGVRARILEPRAVRKAQDSERIIGAGLTAVLELVEGYGGMLEIDDGLDGRGTTVRVVLPAARRAPAVKSRATAADLPKGSGLVLVVDDDPMVRKVVASSLGSLGYKTIEAVSGPAAVEIFRKHRDEVRAVVLDMVMPGMAGKAAYLALREVDPNVAVLLMSGHTLNEQVQEILDLGVRSFVSKPYSIAELAAAIAVLMK